MQDNDFESALFAFTTAVNLDPYDQRFRTKVEFVQKAMAARFTPQP